MIKEHYIKIAEILRNKYGIMWLDESYNTGYKEAIEDIIMELADYFASCNVECDPHSVLYLAEHFDKNVFIKSCGIAD